MQSLRARGDLWMRARYTRPIADLVRPEWGILRWFKLAFRPTVCGTCGASSSAEDETLQIPE